VLEQRRRFPLEGFAILLATVGGFAVCSTRLRAEEGASPEGVDAAPSPVAAQPAAQQAALDAIIDLSARDMPYDDGRETILTWPQMPFDSQAEVEYVVERADSEHGPFSEMLRFPANTRYTSDIEGPWWAWDRGDREAPPHFVVLQTSLRETVSVQIESWPAGLTIPPELADAVVYDSERGELQARKTLTEEQRQQLLDVSGELAFQIAVRKLNGLAKSYDAGGALGEPLTDVPYFFRVRAVQEDRVGPWSEVVSAVPVENWFKLPLLNNLIFVAVLSGTLLFFLEFAKRRQLFLRQIPGLKAVDEAIGRATEMGKAVFYMTGRLDMDNIATIAAATILGEVAKKTAAYGVELKVPHTYSVTMAVCREITRSAYLEAGRPDAYRDEINYYITEEQFSYAAAVNGQMLRERPGAVFYMGYYYAESLLMAETGATTGAIQIAGTNSESQLPFFVTTCDYTLIGEELFAASAYLSRRPELVGTLRGQDLGKIAVMFVVVFGTLLATLGSILEFKAGWFFDFLSKG